MTKKRAKSKIEIFPQLKSFEERTLYESHPCYVHGCNGTVTAAKEPMLLTPQDRMEKWGIDWDKRCPPKIKGDIPRNAVICDTRGTADVSIQGTCDEGVKLAELLDRPIAWDFNGHTVIARKGDDPEALWRDWWKRMSGKTYEESRAER